MEEPQTAMTRVILVRHGQSTYNIEHRIQGRLDHSTLTEVGQTTARQVATVLDGISFDAIYSSPLQRARQTAETIAAELAKRDSKAIPVQFVENLREIDLPLWEGMLRDEVQTQFAEDYRCWKQRPHELKMLVETDGETREHFPVLALREQAKAFWEDLLNRHQNGTVLVVAHNGINRCLLSIALGIDASAYHSIQQSNCGVSVLNFAGGLNDTVQLESMNLTHHVGDKFPNPRPGHRGPRLLLVRHGETEWNRNGQFQGQIDVPLNENGKAQAQKAADFLKEVEIDAAVSSSMLRPKETAEIILQHHPQIELKLHDGLREISHGLWEGKFEAEIEQEFPGMLTQWQQSPETVQMPEGENLQDVWRRAIAAWRQVVEAAEPNTTTLVVGHDAINKAILCHLFGLGPEHFWNFKQGNGAITVIDYPKGADGPPVLEASNITSHFGSGVLDKTAAGAL
jgi:broad specificity phosphatase PhoE